MSELSYTPRCKPAQLSAFVAAPQYFMQFTHILLCHASTFGGFKIQETAQYLGRGTDAFLCESTSEH